MSNATKINETEALIADLCERFTHIFEQIKEIKKSRQELEEENRSLQAMIQEENQKFEEIAEQLEGATEDLQRKCDDAERAVGSQQNGANSGGISSSIANIERLQQDLDEKKALLEVAQTKLRDVTAELSANEQVRAALDRQKGALEERLNALRGKIGEHQEVAATVEANLTEVNARNEELALKVKTLVSTIAHNEAELKQTLEAKHQREDDYKLSVQEYREVLAQSSQYAQKTKETEKVIARLRDELKSKLGRLEVLVKNKTKLETRVQRLEAVRAAYEDQCQKNQALAEDNQKLSQKLQLYLEQNDVTPAAFKNHAGSTNLSRTTSKQQLNQSATADRQNTTHASLLAGTPAARRETELYRLARQNVLQTDYLQALAKQLTDRDTQIYENKKKINRLNEDITAMRERVAKTRAERADLEEKYTLMKQSTDQLKAQYVQLCLEYGIIEDAPARASPGKNNTSTNYKK